jgi:heme oxygenase (biliverdin-IX-beta and delta-forming)
VDQEAASRLRRLLDERPVAALATLHRGDPAASMVPFVVPPGESRLLIHVSALAPHTADMREHRRVGLLVMAEPGDQTPPLALPRVAFQADAVIVDRDGADHPAARAAYLARFPDASTLFGLADFSLVWLHPVSARLVAGFGRAHSLVGEPLANWLRA